MGPAEGRGTEGRGRGGVDSKETKRDKDMNIMHI